MKHILIIFSLFLSFSALAENGSELWLRYRQFTPLASEALQPYNTVVSDEKNETIDLAIGELQSAWQAFLGKPLSAANTIKRSGIVLGTKNSKTIQSLIPTGELETVGSEGYIIRYSKGKDREQLVIAAQSPVGVLYGTFHLLRLIQTGECLVNLDIKESPKYDIRILNHWDNLDRTVERGYAGYSLWKWDELPNTISPRYKEYARANASIGINATVLNNVNANPQILTNEYLHKVKAIADVFRPYGIKVYLSINFSSPVMIGGLSTSDPLDADVKEWWKKKADEIYATIPDFGGFLVKANSEGLPGPQDFGRTHADGANMLADALEPHKGIVMWRAFVYSPSDEDRAKQAYTEFVPFDGQFHKNVIIQIKNGAIDFQPREPFSPLFGAMKQTPMMAELQITQEYLGFSNHLVYLAPLFKECLDADTYQDGKGSTVAALTDGSLREQAYSAISGVANIGEDANWCGHHFAQSNWYSFGRLAWDYSLSSAQIADEWIKMTFTDKREFVQPVLQIMLSSRETAVNYMMPLGLHHIFARGHHYGPEPWGDYPNSRADWNPVYYHQADSIGVGFDRTATGSNAIGQYASPVRELYEDIALCPDNLILWFHHVPWQYRMKSGLALWDELCYKYDAGVKSVRDYQKAWDRLEYLIDQQRFKEVQSKLRIQGKDAVWWKDACLLYFQTFSGMPIPYDIERPVNELDDLMKIQLNMTHHN